MRSRLAMMLAAVMGIAGVEGCATTTARVVTPRASRPAAATLRIERVGVEPKTIGVSNATTATIRYDLSRPATVTVDLVDDEGFVARRLEAGKQSVGMHTVVWDGRRAASERVPNGVYRYVIRAQGEDGQQAIHDPSGQTGGEEVHVRDFTFDPETGLLRWIMPMAGYVRVVMGLQGFPHLRTLLDWEPTEAGEHAIVWDGLDHSGFIKLKEHPELSIKLNAFAMPFNTIIVRGASSAPAQSPEGPPTYPSMVKGAGAYLHARHSRAHCHQLQVRLEFPRATSHDTRHRPILTGTVPVQVTLEAREAPDVINQRFELALFEDLTFLFEEEEGSTPFTYLWNTSHLPPGEHLLTVNILTYDDHDGVDTQQVVIGATP